MLTRFLDYDAFSDMETLFHYDEVNDTTYIETKQNVEPQLEASKGLQIDAEYSKAGIKNDMWHYAHIPNGIIEKWRVEKGIDVYNRDHQKAVFALLNDPEYRHLKTTAGYHQPKR
jgi:hypothetical protein